MFPISYDRAADLREGPTPGAVALRDWMLERYPPGTNLGIWVARPIRGATAVSMHWTGRAVDIGFPGDVNEPHEAGRRLANDLVRWNPILGVQCVIFARRIWSSVHPREWRNYRGKDGHWTHVHVELNRVSAAQLTPSLIRLLVPPEVPVRSDNHTWSLLDFSDTMLVVHDLYDLFVGTGADDEGRRAWGRDLAAKLARGEHPKPTIGFIHHTLAQAHR